MTDLTAALCFLLILLAPLAAAGLALINTGLGRSRSAAHMMLSCLCVFSVAAVVFFVVGFAWQGYPGRAGYAFAIGGKSWNWIAAEPFFWRGLRLDGSPASLAALLGMMSAGLAAVIPLGSGADRWRLGAACASTALLAGWTYPLFAHWVWGGGWLAQLGTNYGLGRGLVDAGGALPIQAVGGVTALAVTWVLKARRGKYTQDRMPMAIPGHNAVLVLLGCFLAWLGWIGLDGAGAILYYGAEAGRGVLIAANATLAAASAMLSAACITRVRYGKPDASVSANGWVGGLVASSAGCAVMPPAAAMIVGIVAGALVTFGVEWLELYLTVDDPGGAVSVHLLGGVWGALATGLFARFPAGENASGQWIAQLAGIATLFGFVLPLTYGLNWALDRFSPMRVRQEGERQGLDLHELGAGAYPDFISHKDD
jgi:Amt family ammonium transporter